MELGRAGFLKKLGTPVQPTERAVKNRWQWDSAGNSELRLTKPNPG
jgi:hypothetical protein